VVLATGLAGMGMAIWLQPKDEQRIQSRLDGLTAALSHDRPVDEAWNTKLRAAVEHGVASSLTLEIAEGPDGEWTQPEIIRAAAQLGHRDSALGLQTQGVTVKVDAKAGLAQAGGDVLVRRVLANGRVDLRQRQFAATLLEDDGDWRLEALRLAPERHDQPEARP